MMAIKKLRRRRPHKTTAPHKHKKPHTKKQIHEQGTTDNKLAREIMRWFVLQKIYAYFVKEYSKDIVPAGISTSPRHVATKSVLYTATAAPAGTIIGMTVMLALTNMMPANLTIHAELFAPFITVTTTISLPAAVFFSRRFSLREAIKRRAKGVESELLFFTVYCDVMEKTGRGLRGAFESIRKEGTSIDATINNKNKNRQRIMSANANGKTARRQQLFPAMYHEACIIHREIQVFSKSFVDMIRDLGITHPSGSFRDFLRGYLISQESGGTGVGVFLHEKLREYHVDAKQKLESYGNTSEMLATVGSFGLVMFPIFVVVGGIILSPATLLLMCMLGILLIPGAIAFLVRVAAKAAPIPTPKIAMQKTPLMLSTVVGIGLVMLAVISAPPLLLPPLSPSPTATEAVAATVNDYVTPRTAALAASDTHPPPLLSSWWELATIPIITWCAANFLAARKSLSKMINLEKSIPDFIRDINQKTKSNPSFYAAFTTTEASAPYTKQFNHTLHQIKSRLLLGISMASALSETNTGSWLYDCTMRLMAFAVRTGSVTPAVLDRLSMFASHYLESRKSLAAKTVTPLMTGYMGSIIVVMMILMMPVSGFEGSLDSLTGAGNMGGAEIISQQENNFDAQALLDELNMMLVIIGAFCSMLLISQIRYGTVLHSMHTAVLLIVVSGMFYYDRYVGVAGFGS